MFAGIDTPQRHPGRGGNRPRGVRGDSAPIAQPGQRVPPAAGCADQPRGDAGGHGRSGNFGWPAAIYLLERDLNVVDVPPLMTSRERLSQPGQGKTT